jgi:hypothetical protein
MSEYLTLWARGFLLSVVMGGGGTIGLDVLPFLRTVRGVELGCSAPQTLSDSELACIIAKHSSWM